MIRRARAQDAAAVAELGARTFSETFGHLYPPQDLAAFLAHAHSPAAVAADLADAAKAIWLALEDERPVGYALAGPCDLPHPEVTPACGELKRLYILQDRQNSGLGAALFAEAMAWLQSRGPRDVWIGVWSENLGAQRFYARQGFERVGEYGFAVGDTVDHELILRRVADSFSN